MNPINTTNIAVASSTGADINGMTLIYMCTLFGFVKAWLQEGCMSMDRAKIYDTDTTKQRERIFSDAECSEYLKFSRPHWYGDCVNNTMVYETNTKYLHEFTRCITTHFMTEMGANNSCSDDSVRPDNDTNVKNTMTLLLKDHLFYTFLVNTLKAKNICEATHDTVTLSTPNCDWYKNLIKHYHADSVCVYNTPSIDNDIDTSYGNCLLYR